MKDPLDSLEERFIALFRKLPDDIRDGVMKSRIAQMELQFQTGDLLNAAFLSEEEQKEAFLSYYQSLASYIMTLTEFRKKAIEVKEKFEKELDLSE